MLLRQLPKEIVMKIALHCSNIVALNEVIPFDISFVAACKIQAAFLKMPREGSFVSVVTRCVNERREISGRIVRRMQLPHPNKMWVIKVIGSPYIYYMYLERNQFIFTHVP